MPTKQINIPLRSRFLGVQAIADNMGVRREAVYAWLQRHGPGSDSLTPVPQPDVAVVQGTEDNARMVYGWSPTSISDWRIWFAKFKDMTELEAAHYWVDVENNMRKASERVRRA